MPPRQTATVLKNRFELIVSAKNVSMGRLTEWFEREFARLYSDWREVIKRLKPGTIYQPAAGRAASCGEQVVRSARVVEQAFGGITANLWDDPFEWTLPETLTTAEKVLDYLDEVEATRQRGFGLLKSDEDLMKDVMTPSGTMQLASLLLDTLVRARHYQLKAVEIRKQIESAGTADTAQSSGIV